MLKIGASFRAKSVPSPVHPVTSTGNRNHPESAAGIAMNIRLSIASIVTAGILIAAPSGILFAAPASFAWTYCVEFDDTFPSNARQTPALRFVIEVRVGGGREQQYATVRPTKVGTFHRVRARSYPMTADREVCARSEDFADFVKAQSGRDDVEIGYIYAEMSAGRTGCPYSDGADKRVTASRVLREIVYDGSVWKSYYATCR